MLLVIDGLDASGKSTQAQYLLKFLTAKGQTVCLRLHPSADNFFGSKAKQFLYAKGKSAHFATAFFYMLDVIRSILMYSWQKYDYIIFVRYLMGTAYLPSPLHKIAYNFFSLLVPTSEFMFFLDITPEEAYKRICRTRGKQEMFESLDELRKVRLKALSLTQAGRWKIINANSSEREVSSAILNYLMHLKRIM
ncbi:MAG: thymidylate kinase [Candidatus Bathyarchaeota archaeon]|nr:thymidylate kinase [Candidatus Bathyarchaeota archaeon]